VAEERGEVSGAQPGMGSYGLQRSKRLWTARAGAVEAGEPPFESGDVIAGEGRGCGKLVARIRAAGVMKADPVDGKAAVATEVGHERPG